MTLRLDERFDRRPALRVPLHLVIEIQRREDQQLLETVVERLGELFARPLLGERQVRRELTQLRRPVLQFDRPFAKRGGDPPAVGDVRHERNRLSAVGRGDVVQADFDRKARAVPALTDEIDVRTHESRTRRRK